MKTSDYVQKLLKMHEKASEANLLDALQASQIVDGVRTWVSKWFVVTRVPLVRASVHGSVGVGVSSQKLKLRLSKVSGAEVHGGVQVCHGFVR